MTKGAKDFKTLWQAASTETQNHFYELIQRSDAREDPCWNRLFGAKPTRGVLIRLSWSVGVKVHPSNGFRNYQSIEEFTAEVKCTREWYSTCRRLQDHGRQGIGKARKIVTSKKKSVNKAVFNSTLSKVYKTILTDRVKDSLWNWRKIARALRLTGIPFASGTTPVERHWSNAAAFFNNAGVNMSERWFTFLSNLAFLRYNYRHFHKCTLPSWCRSDSLLSERSEMLLHITRQLQQPGSSAISEALAAAFHEVQDDNSNGRGISESSTAGPSSRSHPHTQQCEVASVPPPRGTC